MSQTPEQMLAEARELSARVARGDLMIGIMDLSELDRMLELYEEASQSGLAAASFEYAQLGLKPLL